MNSLTLELVISFLLLAGSITVLVGAIGVIRFPDVYNRMHATSKNTTLGAISILLGATIWFSFEFGLTLKLLLALPFLFWTASAGAFMIGRAAHRTGTPMARTTVRDDLATKKGIHREGF
jgi:multicomponent Na+:H+ antiporter subunit G